MTFTKDPSTHPAHYPLTEERLIRVRDELAAAAKRSDGGNLGYMMADAAKAIDELLAYRDAGQEPVAIVDMQSGRTNGDKFALVYCPAMHKQPDDVYYLYAAPQLPQPAVPDEAEMPSGPGVPEYNVGWANGWNSCREEMLQGAEPVSQPYTLRDGWVAVPVEPTKEMISAGQDEMDNCIENGFDSDIDGNRFDYTEISSDAPYIIYRAMIAAAPQQEADTDNTTQQFESLGLVATSDERNMEITRCSKHADTALQVHPFEQLMSYPPRPKMYCPECEPGMAEHAERENNLRLRKGG